MKNKIFELYKPNSLEEFKIFYKDNPKEKFVYVVQQPGPNINILSASDYGYLVICLPQFEQDYLLTVGDPVIIGISCIAINDATNGKFNVLKWERDQKRYYSLEFDIYMKG